MSEQEKNDKESMICLMPRSSQSFLVYHIQNKEFFFTEKEHFKEKGEWRIEQKKKKKPKRRLFIFSLYGD